MRERESELVLCVYTKLWIKLKKPDLNRKFFGITLTLYELLTLDVKFLVPYISRNLQPDQRLTSYKRTCVTDVWLILETVFVNLSSRLLLEKKIIIFWIF